MSEELLSQEVLQPPSPLHRHLVHRRQFLEPQHGDDILKLSIPLDRLLHGKRDLIVPCPDP